MPGWETRSLVARSARLVVLPEASGVPVGLVAPESRSLGLSLQLWYCKLLIDAIRPAGAEVVDRHLRGEITESCGDERDLARRSCTCALRGRL